MPRVRPHNLMAVAALLAAIAPARAADEPPALAALAREASLEAIVTLALARNPDLAEERARVASARALTDQAGRLARPAAEIRAVGRPAVQRPLALRRGERGDARAQPDLARARHPGRARAGGGARRRAARRASEAAAPARAAGPGPPGVRRILPGRPGAAAAPRARRADRPAGGAVARPATAPGKRSQQDVLRLNLELSRLHRDLAHIEQERISAQALLNALMNRPPTRRWARPPSWTPAADRRLPPAATRATDAARPELARGRRQRPAKRGGAGPGPARARAGPASPSGADYMYMPLMEEPHGYGAMVDAEPALAEPGPRRRRPGRRGVPDRRPPRARSRSATSSATRCGTPAPATRPPASTFDIIDTDLLPQAQRNFDAAYASYAAGPGRRHRRWSTRFAATWTCGLDRVRALVHLANAAADLARATGEQGGSPMTRRSSESRRSRRRRGAQHGRRPLGAGRADGARRRRLGAVRTSAAAAAARRPARQGDALLLPDAPADRAGPPRRLPDLQHDPGAQARPAPARGRRRTMTPPAAPARGPPPHRSRAGAGATSRLERVQKIGVRTAKVTRQALGGRPAHRRRRCRPTSAGWPASRPASPAGSRQLQVVRDRPAGAARARRWRPSTARRCCRRSRSC